MPIYEYICTACETKFDVLQRSHKQKNTPKCPTCSSQNAKKRISTFSALGTQKETANEGAT